MFFFPSCIVAESQVFLCPWESRVGGEREGWIRREGAGEEIQQASPSPMDASPLPPKFTLYLLRVASGFRIRVRAPPVPLLQGSWGGGRGWRAAGRGDPGGREDWDEEFSAGAWLEGQERVCSFLSLPEEGL